MTSRIESRVHNRSSMNKLRKLRMIRWSWLLIFIGCQSVVFAHDLGHGVGNYAECGSGKVRYHHSRISMVSLNSYTIDRIYYLWLYSLGAVKKAHSSEVKLSRKR